MFDECSKFNQDLSSWDVSNCKNFAYMFGYCTEFNQDLSVWDISNGENFINMFQWCPALRHQQKWDLSHIDWSKKRFMYQGCACEHENE